MFSSSSLFIKVGAVFQRNEGQRDIPPASLFGRYHNRLQSSKIFSRKKEAGLLPARLEHCFNQQANQ
jgi:hypothetical protein